MTEQDPPASRILYPLRGSAGTETHRAGGGPVRGTLMVDARFDSSLTEGSCMGPARDWAAAAARELAAAVKEQAFAAGRIRDWEKPPLIPVRWSRRAMPETGQETSSPPGAAMGRPQLTSDTPEAELAGWFLTLESPRLVILGGPGTGKTTLAVQLLLGLLASHNHGGSDVPVPVLISVAQWDVNRHPALQSWLAAQVHRNHPGMRWPEVDGIKRLVDLGRVVPILDGLDELPAPARTAVIERLNDSLGPHDRLILISRTAEYTDAAAAMGAAQGLEAATVIEPAPITPSAAADYLESSLQSHQVIQPSWVAALRMLRTQPASALAEVVADPLSLWLVRAVYVKGVGGHRASDPGELSDPSRVPTAAELRAHLFDRLIAAVLPRDEYGARVLGLSRLYEPGDVTRWLGFLAHHLAVQPPAHDTADPHAQNLAWWRLAATTRQRPRQDRPARRAAGLTAALTAGLIVGLTVAVVIGVVVGLGVGVAIGLADGPVAGLATGSTAGAAFGLVFGLAGGCTAGIRRPQTADDLPGYAGFRAPRCAGSLRPKLRAGFRHGVSCSLIAGPVAGLSTGPVTGLGNGIAVGLVSGPAAGFQTGLTIGLVSGAITGVTFGLAVGVLTGPLGWIEAPSTSATSPSTIDRVITPRASLTADRTLNLIRIASSCLATDPRGERVPESLGRVIHMIFAGRAEYIEGRRRWLAWELDRLGHPEAARLVSDLSVAETGQYMGPGTIPLGPGA